MGRPKITLNDLPKGWAEKCIELGKEGASDVEMRVEALDCICHETWTRLLEEEPLFSETIKKARLYCNQWWEKKGRINLENNTFSYTGWYMNMKNRFGWRDKNENENTTKVQAFISSEPMTTDEWEEEYKED